MPYRDKQTRKHHIKSLSAESVSRVREVLQDGKMHGVREIADKLNYSVHTTQEAMDSLEFHGVAHLHAYETIKTGGHSGLWIIGPGERAKKPPKQSAEVRKGKMAMYRETYRLRRVQHSAPHRDPLVSALFDEPAPLVKLTKWKGRVVRHSMSTRDEEEMAA